MPYTDNHAASLARADALAIELKKQKELAELGAKTKEQSEAEKEPNATDLDGVNRRFADTIIRAVVERPDDWKVRQHRWTLEVGSDNRSHVDVKLLIFKVSSESWWNNVVRVSRGFTDPNDWNSSNEFGGVEPVILEGYAAKLVIQALKTLPGRQARILAESAAK